MHDIAGSLFTRHTVDGYIMLIWVTQILLLRFGNQWWFYGALTSYWWTLTLDEAWEVHNITSDESRGQRRCDIRTCHVCRRTTSWLTTWWARDAHARSVCYTSKKQWARVVMRFAPISRINGQHQIALQWSMQLWVNMYASKYTKSHIGHSYELYTQHG